MTTRHIRLAVILLAGAAVPALQAQSPALSSHLHDRWQASVSGTWLLYATDLRVDRSDGSAGTDIDPEEDLGLAPGVLQPRIAFRWRPGRKHEIEFGYQMARRSGSTVLGDTIVYGDTSFAAGLRVESDMRSDMLFATYRFAFHDRPRHQLGAALAVGALLLRSNLHAIAGATGGGPDTTIVQYQSTRSMTPPVGSVGLYGRWQIGEPWYVEADARALYLRIDRITVRTAEAAAVARYFFNDRIAAEGGYGLSFFRLDVAPRPSQRGFNGTIRYGLHNFRLGVVARL